MRGRLITVLITVAIIAAGCSGDADNADSPTVAPTATSEATPEARTSATPSEPATEPPDWPEPEDNIPPSAGSGTLTIIFDATWGSHLNPNLPNFGTIHLLVLNGSEESTEELGVFAGHSSPEESGLLPEVDKHASIVAISFNEVGPVTGMTLVTHLDLLKTGATLTIGEDAIEGGVWSIPPGAETLDSFSSFTEGTLELSVAETMPGSSIAGTFSGVFGDPSSDND